MSISLGIGVFVLGVIFGALIVSLTDAGLWAVNAWAYMRGGIWRQSGFWCDGCSKRKHIAKPGPIGPDLCVHCSPHGGAR